MESGQGQRSLIWLFFLVAVLCCAACTRHKVNLPRIDPGHIQWLERQSLMGGTQELTRQVSGSERLWLNSGGRQTSDLLLATAPNWLAVNPHLVASSPGHVFQSIATSPLLDKLVGAGIDGVFLAPTGERSDVWTSTAVDSPVSLLGHNISALRFDAQLGTDKDFDHLANGLEDRHLQLGGLLVPVATGLGPDFMLQARGAARFEGMYAMLNVPREYWGLLPPNGDEWDCKALDTAQLKQLHEAGVLPQAILRDTLDWTSAGGWASTGEVRGVDGNTRRWLYRYAGHVLRPVLLWQDPSGQARRVTSASVIRHTGLQRQTLAGLSMEPLLGLEAGNEVDALAPGFNAIAQLGMEIHRYGGWSLNADAIPPSLWPQLLTEGLDFCVDDALPVAATATLANGNTAPLITLLQSSITQGIPQKRMVRGLAKDATETLAAQILRARQLRAGTANIAQLRSISLLLLGVRAGLPGLCFVSPSDLSGATSIQAAPLWHTGQNVQLFGSLEQQWNDKNSLVHNVFHLLQLRREHKLASATLERVEQLTQGSVAIHNRLPQGNYWITLANFSGTRHTANVSLPRGYANGAVRDLTRNVTLSGAGKSLQIELQPYELRYLILSKP